MECGLGVDPSTQRVAVAGQRRLEPHKNR